MGPKLVIITSVLLANQDDKVISVFASRRHETNGSAEVWRINCPQLPGRYTGTGDLFSALLLGHSALNPNDLPASIEKVMNTMYASIKRSLDLSPEIPLHSTQLRGLMLIQCKDVIENPPDEFKAQLIN